ncbi:MAG: hypothetical protein L0922_02745, partial [Candidatus Mariimomonas ferrooxydans]
MYCAPAGFKSLLIKDILLASINPRLSFLCSSILSIKVSFPIRDLNLPRVRCGVNLLLSRLTPKEAVPSPELHTTSTIT